MKATNYLNQLRHKHSFLYRALNFKSLIIRSFIFIFRFLSFSFELNHAGSSIEVYEPASFFFCFVLFRFFFFSLFVFFFQSRLQTRTLN